LPLYLTLIMNGKFTHQALARWKPSVNGNSFSSLFSYYNRC
jgi:hypothetical protein